MSGFQSAGAKYACAGDGHIRRRAPSRSTRDCVALEQVRREIAAEYAQLTLDYCSTSSLRLIMSPSSAKWPPSREAPRLSRWCRIFAFFGTTAWPPAGPCRTNRAPLRSRRRGPHACSDGWQTQSAVHRRMRVIGVAQAALITPDARSSLLGRGPAIHTM